MAYPAQEEKGFATALFWILFNSGAVVGGLLTLFTNYHSASAAAPSTTTLVCFLSVMLCGTALTALLVPPERVLRRDGRRVNTVSDTRPCGVAPTGSSVFCPLRKPLRLWWLLRDGGRRQPLARDVSGAQRIAQADAPGLEAACGDAADGPAWV